MSCQQQLNWRKLGWKNNKESAYHQQIPYRPERSIKEDATIVNKLRFSEKTLDWVFFRYLRKCL